MALGEVDYGLYGVIGGLTAFIAFFNTLLAGAIGRFYAVSVGESKQSPVVGLESCRQWFSIAVAIHTVVPLLLIAIGYPIGEWAIRSWLNIPPDRVVASLWVFRYVCISCFIGMVNIPFQAMYTAKQYIAELTIYSFVTTALNVCFLYYMVSHPGDWLVRYAFWSMLLAVLPQLIICARAMIVFPECRFRLRAVFDRTKFYELLCYAGWNTFGSMGYLARGHGIAILVNKYFGAASNTSIAIANNVTDHIQSLTNAMQGAFVPAIATAVGEGNLDRVRLLAFRFCKYGLVFLLIFLLPIALELPYVMELWLEKPPPNVVGICWLMLLIAFLDKLTLGYGVAIMAFGKIKYYQIICGCFTLCSLPLAWLFAALGANLYWTISGVVIAWLFLVFGRLVFARRLLDVDVWQWVKYIFRPIVFILSISAFIGIVPRFLMEEGFLRLLVTSGVSEGMFLLLVWQLLLDQEERALVKLKFKRVLLYGKD